MLKNKSKREQAGPQWELLGTSPEEMTDLGEKLRRSKKRPDQTLASAVSPSLDYKLGFSIAFPLYGNAISLSCDKRDSS